MMKVAKFLAIAVPTLLWTACSDSSSGSGDNPQAPGTGEEVLSSASPEGDVQSSDSGEPLSSAETFVPEELVYDSIGFVDIAAAYRTVAPDEKVVFVLRHAERKSKLSKETPLTDNGVQQAQSVGAKLAGGDNFVFGHTDYVRTEETAHNIAIGMGQSDFVHDTIYEITGSWFVKDSDLRESYVTKDTSSNSVTALWAYQGLFADAYYDLEERSLEAVNTYLTKDYSEMPKAKVIISHDEFVVPLLAYATLGTTGVRYGWRPYWINYLAGVAIIVNSKNEKRYICVKGLDSAIL
jgi:broad specificity phosphatase PhoE